MGFWKKVIEQWKVEQAERKWQKKFDSKPVSPEIKSEKDAFTARGEPWVAVLRMDVDPNDLSSGMIELDWNPIFVARLVKAGYHGKDDKAIVDQWFQTICGSIFAGVYENEMADPEKRRRIQKKQLDQDRTEIS